MMKNEINEKNNQEMKQVLLVVQDFTGHAEIELKWDAKDSQANADMKAMFVELKSQGYMFFKVKKKLGFIKTKGEIVSDFTDANGSLLAEKNPEWKSRNNSGDNEMLEKLTDGKLVEYRELEVSVENYSETKKFDPEKDEVEEDVKYIATHPIKGG